MTAEPFFLLARRPGWRAEPLLVVDTEVADGVLRLTRPAPRSIFDCPPVLSLDLPGCCRVVLDADGRVVLLAGTGQILATASDPAWRPTGLVALSGGCVGVVDAARVVHVLAPKLAFDRDLDDVPCPDPGPIVNPVVGTFATVALDSGLPGTRWHRIGLSGVVPQGCQVEVATLTTDADLTAAELALGGSGWVSAGVLGELGTPRDEASGTAAQPGAWDTLVMSAPGRYLWLRLVLRGDGTRTPELTEAAVHLPRNTSLRYLPTIFAAGESDFLERFLALTDTVRDSVTLLLDRLPNELDPRSADADDRRDFLGWLGGWVGMDDITALPVTRQRRLIAAAADLYRRRGTPDGVARHAGLWLGRRTNVLEHFKLRRWAVANQARLGDASVLFGPEVVRRLKVGEFSSIGQFALVGVPSPRTDPFRVFAHTFTLFVYACDGDDPDALAASAARIARAVSPGHVAPVVAVVRADATLGVRSRIGLDAVIAGPPPPGHLGDRLGLALAADPRAAGASTIGNDARVGTRARIG
ncbi:MAG TPA: phage tail protein [Propioniciclava tarda]|nr:phage tail protein [Propioniciclava tarda]